MTDTHHESVRESGTILYVGERTTPPARDLQSASGLEADYVPIDRGIEELTDGGHEPDVVVVETGDRERLTTHLETVEEHFPAVPIIVAPPAERGSEGLAAAAVRAGVTDYVPFEGNLVERVRTTLRVRERENGSEDGRPDSDEKQDHTTSTGTDSEYLRVLAETLPDEAFVIDENGEYLEARVRSDSAHLYTVPAEDLPGSTLQEAFPSETATELLDCVSRSLETGDVQTVEYVTETTAGDRLYEGRVVPIDEPVDGRPAVVWLARDVTERARRERELRRRRDHLETINQINDVVRRVVHTLVEAPTRDDIERKVCDQIVGSGLYCGAWVGEPTSEESLDYRTGSGSATSFLEAVDETTAGDHGRLLERAVETGDVQTVTGLLDPDPESESESESDELATPHQSAVREDEIRSAVAVPITHDGTVYGVLNVVARRDDAFSESEQAAFQLLGETIGFAINAVKNRRLLFADAAIELEFRIDGGDSFSMNLTERFDCACRLEWAGTTTGGKVYQYVTVEGIGGETVLDRAAGDDSIEECRLIHDGGDRCTVEIRLSKSVVRSLTNRGATIRDVTVRDGVATTVVEIPRDADVRRFVDVVQTIYERAELTARREVDRPVHTATERRERILDSLTDRQFTALRLAYYAGYFDWPRGSTGEEIAETMDVSPPTMHQHLRKAQHELLSEFFEERTGPPN
ncbi:bacterio-opsin activator domain-containing protein [Natronoglomus mannanivorans]|uniref:Helix-turn-helix domain-containing protein n=1 Tax=Natronoglomus mannanivorans TaxID=2979990 RepID=A0AAP2YYE3_9EURY|nr:helix-turn-helix domain-containing protein [Halobacteria archaeon AArc-xg1-1]